MHMRASQNRGRHLCYYRCCFVSLVVSVLYVLCAGLGPALLGVLLCVIIGAALLCFLVLLFSLHLHAQSYAVLIDASFFYHT